MDEHMVTEFLRYPRSSLVDFALTEANLTGKEALAINMCGRKRMTQEQAAEATGYSVNAIQKWYRSGIRKLQTAWRGWDWIEKIVT